MSEYDAIVIGARCAGAPTAMVLARRGWRVLLVDRATFPSDTVSTHLLHAPAIAALERWGLLDRVIATGCPPINSYSFDFGPITIAGTPRPVSAAVALALHRTTLEALTNVRKHADAANVEIELAFRDDGLVQLRVRDDGKGAVEETAGTGFGLRGIRERAEQLKGRASYRMAPNEGFTLDVELPA